MGEQSGLQISLLTQRNVVYLIERGPWAKRRPSLQYNEISPYFGLIVSVYCDPFYKKKLDWVAAPRGAESVMSPPATDSQEQASVKGRSLLLKCVNEIKLLSDLRKLAFLFPAGLLIPGSAASALADWLSVTTPSWEIPIGRRHPGCDGFYWPPTASKVVLQNPEELHFNLKWLKSEYGVE